MKQYLTAWRVISILIYLTIIIVFSYRCTTYNDSLRVFIGSVFGAIIGIRICMIINNKD